MSATEKDDKSFWEKHSASIIAVSALCFVVIVWLFTRYSLVNDSQRGTFGDMFGGANALFSGLAFVGLIYAILLQRQELSLQRQELKATRKELKGQREEQEKQNKFIAQQTFENTFFQMLRVLSGVVSAMDINTSATIYQGIDCFSFLKNRLSSFYNSGIKKPESNSFQKAYETIYAEYRQDIGHYYRILYNIIKFIDNAPIENKRLYTNIVRAQLSDDEVYVLFYNCLNPVGRKFKLLVEEYSLLKMTDHDKLLDKKDMELYDKKAFGKTK